MNLGLSFIMKNILKNLAMTYCYRGYGYVVLRVLFDEWFKRCQKVLTSINHGVKLNPVFQSSSRLPNLWADFSMCWKDDKMMSKILCYLINVEFYQVT